MVLSRPTCVVNRSRWLVAKIQTSRQCASLDSIAKGNRGDFHIKKPFSIPSQRTPSVDPPCIKGAFLDIMFYFHFEAEVHFCTLVVSGAL